MTSIDGSCVLAVEDDDDERTLLRLLEDEVMTVVEAGNGRTALAVLHRMPLTS